MEMVTCVQAVIVFKAYQEKGQEVDWANLLYYLIIAFPIFIMPAWWFYLVCTDPESKVGRIAGSKRLFHPEQIHI